MIRKELRIYLFNKVTVGLLAIRLTGIKDDVSKQIVGTRAKTNEYYVVPRLWIY